jgi:hypothetical protein
MAANWYKEQPKNRNFLSPVGFRLKLELFDGVDFFCQTANLPDVSMPFTEVQTRFRGVPIIPGGGVEYGDLTVRFIIDEDMKNYSSVWNWIKINGNAETDHTEGVQYSNGLLMITTSNYNENFFIDFERLFPISLTDIQFDASVNDIEFFTASVTFKYTRYTIRDKSFKII